MAVVIIDIILSFGLSPLVTIRSRHISSTLPKITGLHWKYDMCEE